MAACRQDVSPSADALGNTRIISTAPSITEILFALDLGDQVAGITPYCGYPPAATNLPRTGGLYDPNYEAMLGLDATDIVLFEENESIAQKASELGMNIVRLRHETVDDIIGSLETVGQAFDREARAKALTERMRSAVQQSQAERSGGEPVPAMIVISRQHGVGALESVVLAGRGNYMDELLEIAGGTNVYAGPVPYPNVTREGIMHMNPHVIFDLVPPGISAKTTHEQLRNDWHHVAGVKAVENNRIVILDSDYVFIPGPRIMRLLEDFKKALNER